VICGILRERLDGWKGPEVSAASTGWAAVGSLYSEIARGARVHRPREGHRRRAGLRSLLLLAFPQRIAQTFAKMGDSYVDFAAQVSEERDKVAYSDVIFCSVRQNLAPHLELDIRWCGCRGVWTFANE